MCPAAARMISRVTSVGKSSGPWDHLCGTYCLGASRASSKSAKVWLVCRHGAAFLTCLFFSFHRNILDSDNYSPIPVTNEEVYKRIVGHFPFQDVELEKVSLPWGKRRGASAGAGEPRSLLSAVEDCKWKQQKEKPQTQNPKPSKKNPKKPRSKGRERVDFPCDALLLVWLRKGRTAVPHRFCFQIAVFSCS